MGRGGRLFLYISLELDADLAELHCCQGNARQTFELAQACRVAEDTPRCPFTKQNVKQGDALLLRPLQKNE